MKVRRIRSLYLISILSICYLVQSYSQIERRITSASKIQGETSIAVNPVNSNMLFTVWNDVTPWSPNPYPDGTPGYTKIGFSSSTDGGQYWTPENVVPPIVNGDPSVVIDRTGRVFCCYGNTGSHPAVSRSTDFGINWLPAVTVGGVSNCDKPYIAVDNNGPASPYNGYVYVTWKQSSGGNDYYKFRRSTDNGATYGSEFSLEQMTSLSSAWASIPVVGPTGLLYVAWMNPISSTIKIWKSTNGGAGFVSGGPVTISAYAGADYEISAFGIHPYPAIATDPLNPLNLYVAWQERESPQTSNLRIKFKRSTDGGDNWEPSPRIISGQSATAQQFHPSINVDASGAISVAYMYLENSLSSAYLVTSFDGGASFGTPSQISATSSPYTGEGRTTDYMGVTSVPGKAVPSWTDFRSGNSDIFVAAAGIPTSNRTPPFLSSPANSSTIYSQPLLTWISVYNASPYHVQISTDATFATNIITDVSGIASTSYQASNLQCSVPYYWRVSAGGSWSAGWTFVINPPAAPTLSSPSNSASVAPSPTLIWYLSTGASTYHLQVSTSSDFSTLFIDAPNLGSSSYNTSGMTCATTYYWRVNATGICTGSWSSVWSFTPSLPTVPTLLTPSNSATDVSWCSTTGLSWSALRADNYTIYVSNNPGCAPPYLSGYPVTQSAALLNLTVACATTYYWKVSSNNSCGSQTSSVNQFSTYACAVPPQVNLSEPIDGASMLPTTVHLAWEAATAACSGYHLYVYMAAKGLPVICDLDVAGTTYNVTVTNNKSYRWQVYAKNSYGNGPWSDLWSFDAGLAPVAGYHPVSAEGSAPVGSATSYSIEQNYPNPFNPTTHFKYSLPADVHVTLKVYNIIGQLMATIVDADETAGFKTVEFNAEKLPSGIYYYQMTAGSFSEIKKLLLIK